MGKYLGRGILFVLFVSLFYAMSIITIGVVKSYFRTGNLKYHQGSTGHLYTRLKEAERSTEVDILVIGSSHAYRGFDPRIFAKFGYGIFNLGSSGQTPVQGEILLERYLPKLSPKLVLVVVSPHSLSSDGMESTLDLLSNGPLDVDLFKLVVGRKNITAFNSMIYAAFDKYVLMNTTINEPRKAYGDVYVDGGYVEHEPRRYEPSLHSSVSMQAHEHQKKAFERMIGSLKEADTPYLLVRTPIVQPDVIQGDEGSVHEYFRQRGQYIDLSDLFAGHEHEYFYDRNHLNQAGVDRMNEYFIRVYLQKILPSDGR